MGLPHVGTAGAGGHMRGYAESRHGPSKLRMSSSDHTTPSTQGLQVPTASAALAANLQVNQGAGMVTGITAEACA